jgi:PAS domain S-box-containing protein
MFKKTDFLLAAEELRRRAEDRLRKRLGKDGGEQKSASDDQRLLHELQVHQIELEMQNAELQGTRDETEALLEKYTDLYDFAPVGYFSLDERGRILDVNLTGTVLLGVERSRLIDQCLPRFVAPASRPFFLLFLKQLFAGPEKRVCEATLLKANGEAFWANFHGTSAISLDSSLKWCRVAISDITIQKQAEEAQHRFEAITATNLALQHEIAQRKAAEDAVRQSEQHQSQLLEQSRHLQQQLRQLSHRILHVQEEERKRISRELHDEVTQTLVGISVHLETLAKEAAINPKGLKQKVARTQRLVEKSVEVVHRFARELRPTMLDDLGLIPALRSLMKTFMKETGIRAGLTAFEEVERLSAAKRTVLYRVAQEALHNVARHAHATKVEVSIQRLPRALLMQIKDNGRSFDVESALKPKKNKRLGLIGMRERLEMVNGQFAIESAPGKGTTIQAQIPFVGRVKERAQS